MYTFEILYKILHAATNRTHVSAKLLCCEIVPEVHVQVTIYKTDLLQWIPYTTTIHNNVSAPLCAFLFFMFLHYFLSCYRQFSEIIAPICFNNNPRAKKLLLKIDVIFANCVEIDETSILTISNGYRKYL